MAALSEVDESRFPSFYLDDGRWYSKFRHEKYLFPLDENEKERLDLFHKMFLVTRNNVLHSAPIQNRDSPRVLDLGCGTGIWAIDVADMYYERHGFVMAVDLCMIQPERIPDNLRFIQVDIEDPWPPVLTSQPWDLIRCGMLWGSIQSWPTLYTTIYRNLKPYDGYIEHVEIDFTPRCDDGTLPRDSALNEWAGRLFKVMDDHRRIMRADGDQVARWMMDVGFVDFHEETYLLPLNSWPMGNEKHVGRWFNIGFTNALEALTLAPLRRKANMTYEQVQELINRVKKEANSRDIHAYCLMYVWTARKAK